MGARKCGISAASVGTRKAMQADMVTVSDDVLGTTALQQVCF